MCLQWVKQDTKYKLDMHAEISIQIADMYQSHKILSLLIVLCIHTCQTLCIILSRVHK